jgi:flagellar FliL protein
MPDETLPPGGRRAGTTRLLTVILPVGAGLLIGAASGGFVAGPAVARHLAARAAADEASGRATAHHVLDNLVLNPAGSGGTRYLLVTVVFDVRDQGIADDMIARDAEVRDATLRVLGAKTVEQLADLGARDGIKQELTATVGALFPRGAVRRVYFPQFVIQ